MKIIAKKGKIVIVNKNKEIELPLNMRIWVNTAFNIAELDKYAGRGKIVYPLRKGEK